MEEQTHEIANSLKLIGQYDAEIDSLKAWFALNPGGKPMADDVSDIWHGKFGRLKLCKEERGVRCRAVPRHQAKLDRLKAVLGEFDTEPMVFLDNGSVVAR